MSSRKKESGPDASLMSMARLALPETTEYMSLMKYLSTLLQDRVDHPVCGPYFICPVSSMIINVSCSGTHRDMLEERC